jgi:indole-3-glycerol phosphate synthase
LIPYNETSFMASKLDQIIAATRVRVAETKQRVALSELERDAEKHVPRGFRRALEQDARSGIAIIAELKKASPSKGLIRAEFDPSLLARELERAGATALSVLTDEKFFQGSNENLRKASEATNVPCLRKDFIVEEYQLIEARAFRADAVLLIVAALDQPTLVHLAKRASGLDLDVLCEAHDEEELSRALDAGCNLVGVNSRDLKTFQVNIETAIGLAERIPQGVVAVAESGIDSGSDVARLRQAGYDAFLIGESLMRAESPGNALRELLESASKHDKLLTSKR